MGISPNVPRPTASRIKWSKLSKHVVSHALYKGGMINRARSLVPLRAGVMAGLTARPYFASRAEMGVQLKGLKAYCEERHAKRMAVAPKRALRTYPPTATAALATLALGA